MYSPHVNLSPTFKHLKGRTKCSPIEIKEKLRKNYQDKIQNCRNVLMNRFRGTDKMNVKSTLTEIYNKMFQFSDTTIIDEEEIKILEEIQKELVQEEFEWWLKEYDKSQMGNIESYSADSENTVICPICQKNNLIIHNSLLSCPLCKSSIKTEKTLSEIKSSIMNCLEKHSSVCNKEFQFALMPEFDENHIYLICTGCKDITVAV